ncbi:Monocarboxylate transporter 7 [Holothuria leucospilota]|uniref:Monocarboxylate transporter 7 n=1 Tax=Holothuria leucospilota TaxID=206669 RepID=A0A9Q0YIY0_HOLLE|nr:Monocarboxylate transporter 7 [Holothuria leucospilota]
MENMKENRRRLSWIVFASACVRVFFASGSLKANGVILEDLVVRFNSSHSLVAWAFSLQNGCSLLITPVGTMLLQIFSHRQLSITGGFCAGAGYILSGLFAEEVWHIFATYILSGIGFGLTIISGYLALKENFPDNISTVSCFAELFHFVGMATMPTVLNSLKVQFGLRNSLILLGAIMWNLIPCGVGITIPKDTNNSRTVVKKGQPHESIEKEEKLDNVEYDLLKRGSLLMFMESYFPFFLPFYYHMTFRYLVIFTLTGAYVYTSWVIFLISLGTSLDLPMDQAVFLSTVGGVSGLLGKLLGATLFYVDKANVYIACLSLLGNALSMLAVIFMRNYLMIAALTFCSGLSLGLSTNLLYGMIPLMVCSHHFPPAFSVVLLLQGAVIQLSGLLSGVVRDAMGSTVYVFGFNGILCLAVLPFMIPWVCTDQTVETCRFG